ncbi:MAG: glycine/betaine ABC transporter substrate-binding protein [Ktedonobacterales bacterium]|nr:glycine/betaine ABC transporter substrate-binding protein [Ktedonobacterales bacterium]
MRVSRMFALPMTLIIGAVLLLSACGSTSTSGGGTGAPKTVVLGSKKDGDSVLEAQMYKALLEKAGYKVDLKDGLDNKTASPAIFGGNLDLYPEFTGTGLGNLGLPTSADPQTAYNNVKAAYETQKQITWLDAAFNLNDGYGICAPNAVAQKNNWTKISDIVGVANTLRLATPPDAVSQPDVLPNMLKVYGITFKKTTQLDSTLAYTSVTQGQADVLVCYTTDANIVTQGFTLLTDDKVAFPAYNPAPIVRDQVLAAHPDLKTILNPLATKLTTAEITKLIKLYAIDKTPADIVAKQWLKDQGLL